MFYSIGRLSLIGFLCAAGISPALSASYQYRVYLPGAVAKPVTPTSTPGDLPPEAPLAYAWSPGAWTACSATCGTGTQSREVACNRADGVLSDPAFCDLGSRPARTQSCTASTPKCAEGGTLYAWGYNSTNAILGSGTTTDQLVPMSIMSEDVSVTQVTSTGYSSFAVSSTGALYHWGYNSPGGVRGPGSAGGVYTTPSPILEGDSWKTVGAAQARGYGVKSDGTLWRWGVRFLAGSQLDTEPALVRVGSRTDWVSIKGDENSTSRVAFLSSGGDLCFMGTSGSVAFTNTSGGGWCNSQVGEVTTEPKCTVTGVTNFAVDGLGTHFVKNGVLSGCGSNGTNPSCWTLAMTGKQNCSYTNGLYAGEGTEHVLFPTSISGMNQVRTWSQVSKGSRDGGVALATDGSIWAWGGARSTFANNTLQTWTSPVPSIISSALWNSYSPRQLDTGTDWAQLAAGNDFVIAIKTDGTLWGWGSNAYGQLGVGDRISRATPAQIGSENTWKSVYVKGASVFAIKSRPPHN